eukprot:10879839-Prorocentrum_lima.AAC.1
MPSCRRCRTDDARASCSSPRGLASRPGARSQRTGVDANIHGEVHVQASASSKQGYASKASRPSWRR